MVRNKAVYVALAPDAEGHKQVLGLWIEQVEGASFWLKLMNDLKIRGLGDILIAVVDGLKGFPEAIRAVFPGALVQTCIVHLIRRSLAFISWKNFKAMLPVLKLRGRERRGPQDRPPAHSRSTADGITVHRPELAACQHVTPLFAFPPAIYTTNAVESLNRSRPRSSILAQLLWTATAPH